MILCWIRGQFGIGGNEEAHDLANIVSARLVEVIDCALSSESAKTVLNESFINLSKELWDKSPVQNDTKSSIPSEMQKKTEEIVKLSKNQLLGNW